MLSFKKLLWLSGNDFRIERTLVHHCIPMFFYKIIFPLYKLFTSATQRKPFSIHTWQNKSKCRELSHCESEQYQTSRHWAHSRLNTLPGPVEIRRTRLLPPLCRLVAATETIWKIQMAKILSLNSSMVQCTAAVLDRTPCATRPSPAYTALLTTALALHGQGPAVQLLFPSSTRTHY